MAYNDYLKQRIIHCKGYGTPSFASRRSSCKNVFSRNYYASTIVKWLGGRRQLRVGAGLVTSCVYRDRQRAYVCAWEVEGCQNAKTGVKETTKSVMYT